MPQPAPLRTELLSAALAGAPIVERVTVARVQLAPGQAAGRHLHPCPVLGHVLEGAIRFQVVDAAEIVLGPGDAFYEPAGVEIPHFDNASDTEAAVFVACYLLTPGEDRLIEMLK